jgi:hypothetical protein
LVFLKAREKCDVQGERDEKVKATQSVAPGLNPQDHVTAENIGL